MMPRHRYDRIPFEDTTLPIRINYSMTISPPAVLKAVDFSWHEQIELLFFRGGEAVVHCGSNSFAAKEGDIILINPYEVHQVEYVSGCLVYDCLMIDASMYQNVTYNVKEESLAACIAQNYIRFDNYIVGDSEIVNYIESLCAEIKSKEPFYELAVRAYMFGLLACLLRRHVCIPVQHFSVNVDQYERIKPALELMKSKFSEPITLKDFADVCHLSASHFCRLFHQITGYTPVRYLTYIRLQEAATQLKRTDKSVTQIAYDVGFNDIGYFSRKFKEQFGISPIKAKMHSESMK